MVVKWKTDFDPNELAIRIEKSRKVAEDGSVTFEGWDFRLYGTLLYSMLDFSEEIPEIDARNITRKSIRKAGEKGEISKNSLLKEIKILENKYHKQPVERFALATSLSVGQMTQIRRINIGRTQIIIGGQLPRRFIREAAKIRKEASQILYAPPPRHYSALRAHVSAKSHNEAVNKALDAIDLIRGIWNLYENKKHSTRISVGGIPKPVNKIILGPFHTLHYPNGKLAATSTWWYEPSYLGAVQLHRIVEIGSFFEYLNNVRSLLDKSHYKSELEKAIIRYSRSLDERDWNNAFLRLWGVLELLTDTIKQSYDSTIKRTAFLYQDYEFYLQILKHLRYFRNLSVHSDAENPEIESDLFQLKNFVEDLLYFHLANSRRFKSMEEAGRFLSLPRNKNALKSRVELANFAIEFLGYKKKE